MKKQLISVVIPAYNEEKNIVRLHAALKKQAIALADFNFEYIFVDDGSQDGTAVKVQKLKGGKVRLIQLSRNFGKEVATTAGLVGSRGDSAIMIDADLQHPVNLLPKFINKWQKGADVVIGVRQDTAGESLSKKFRSWLFYKTLNSMAETKVMPNATDYRLLDRVVINEFIRFTERNRITRGLIDWLGFKRDYIYFKADSRDDEPRYDTSKLIHLAISSFVSLSLLPLKVAGYTGIIITGLAGILGLFIFIERYVLGDPLSLGFSGPAILAIINLFLVGIVLSCLGLIALYIANIHSEVVNRPLYVIKPQNKKPRGRK